jgi:hypothetical protein
MNRKVKLFGRFRLTPTQRRAWLALADVAPVSVTTVDQLLGWVRARKARLIAQCSDDDVLRGELGCLDALFEWSTGMQMPDPPVKRPTKSTAPRSARGLTCHDGGRLELEREWFTLVITGQGDSARARSLCELLERRGWTQGGS